MSSDRLFSTQNAIALTLNQIYNCAISPSKTATNQHLQLNRKDLYILAQMILQELQKQALQLPTGGGNNYNIACFKIKKAIRF